jgi:hypothetical protein
MKSINGMDSYQNDLVKFSIFLKHSDIKESRQYMAKNLVKLLLGED